MKKKNYFYYIYFCFKVYDHDLTRCTHVQEYKVELVSEIIIIKLKLVFNEN